ncbi:MAG: hypothetical protein QXT53_06710 [Ignisphaera sp.]
MANIIPQQYLDFLRKIYLLRRVTVTRLKEDLGMDYRVIRNIFLSFAHRYKVRFWVDILQQRLGLNLTLLILKKARVYLLEKHGAIKELLNLKLPFVRSISLTLDGGLQLIIQNPFGSKLVIEDNMKNFVRSIYSFNFVLRSKPHPNLLQSYLKGDYNYLLNNGIQTAFENKYDIDEEYLLTPTKFDSLDLVILDIIEDKPYITLRALTKKVNEVLLKSFTVDRIERHVVKHVENLILGYRMAGASFAEFSNYGSTLITSCKNCIDFCSRAISHPFIVSCVGNANSGVTGVSVLAPRAVHNDFVISLDKALSSYGCEPVEEVINYFVVEPYYIFYGVPRPYPVEVRAGLDVETEYDPRSRAWSPEIDVTRIIESLRKYLA